jgi:hypothetical protein
MYWILNELSRTRTCITSLRTNSSDTDAFALILLAEYIRILSVKLLCYFVLWVVTKYRVVVYLLSLFTCVSCGFMPLFLYENLCINLPFMQYVSSGSPAKMFLTYLIPQTCYVISTS